MNVFAFVVVFVVLTLPSAYATCDMVRVDGGARGTLVFDVIDAAVDMESTTLCRADGSKVRPVALPGEGRVADLSWQGSSGKMVILRCKRAQESGAACIVVGVDGAGFAAEIFPPHDSPYLEEADGRLSPWYLSRARISPDGRSLAVVLNGRGLILGLPMGRVQAEFGYDVRDLVWISAKAVAFTQPTARERAGQSEAQAFVFRLDASREEQITQFAPLRRSAWIPFAEPRTQYQLVRGLTWASGVEKLAFLLFPAAELYELRGLSSLHGLGPLNGRCYVQLAISEDGNQVAYVTGTTAAACLIAGGAEVRLRDLTTGGDRRLMHLEESSFYFRHLAWRAGSPGEASEKGE